MLRRCCCFDLRTGSVFIGALRLISWLLILTAGTYVCWQLFILGHRGMVHYTVMINLEENAYVLGMVIIVSLIGVFLESLLIWGVLQPHRAGYIRAWFWLTGFTILSSIVLAVSFLLHNIGSIAIGGSWFENALCSLADIVFFFIPEYFLGPRLQPVLHAMLIISHFLIPILHSLSFYVVYSFYKCRHMYLYNQNQDTIGGQGLFGNVTPSCPEVGGRRSVTPMIQDQVIPYKPKLCQKCQHATMQHDHANGVVYTSRCQQPLIEEAPIETTC